MNDYQKCMYHLPKTKSEAVFMISLDKKETEKLYGLFNLLLKLEDLSPAEKNVVDAMSRQLNGVLAFSSFHGWRNGTELVIELKLKG